MNSLEQAVLGPIRSELIGHNAVFYSPGGTIVVENITKVDLDDYGKAIRITADRMIHSVPGTEKTFETNQRRIHISYKYTVTK